MLLQKGEKQPSGAVGAQLTSPKWTLKNSCIFRLFLLIYILAFLFSLKENEKKNSMVAINSSFEWGILPC